MRPPIDWPGSPTTCRQRCWASIWDDNFKGWYRSTLE